MMHLTGRQKSLAVSSLVLAKSAMLKCGRRKEAEEIADILAFFGKEWGICGYTELNII
jgi:hypothetical protein